MQIRSFKLEVPLIGFIKGFCARHQYSF